MAKSTDSDNEKLDTSFQEFVDLCTETDKRIGSIETIQQRLLNHISMLENINKMLETKMHATKDMADRIKVSKSITYNFEKLIKLYEVYRSYEDTVQKYYNSTSETINKKYRIELDKKKSKTEGTSSDFFRQLNSFLVKNNNTDLNELAIVEDVGLQL